MLEIIVGLLAFILLLILLNAAVVAGIWWARRTPKAKGSPVKRIELSGGQWAKARMRLTQSMWESLVAAKPQNVERSEDGRVVDASGADVTDFIADVIARSLIIAGVTEWSYGEVELDVLADEVPLDDQQVLSDHFDAVLTASPHFRRVTGGI